MHAQAQTLFILVQLSFFSILVVRLACKIWAERKMKVKEITMTGILFQ